MSVAHQQIALLGRRAGLSDEEAAAFAAEVLDAYRAEVLTEAADRLALDLSTDEPSLPGYPLALKSAVRALRSMSDEVTS